MTYGRICLSIAIIIYLISFIDIERLKNVIPGMQLKYAWQPYLLVMLSYFMMAVRWSILLRQFSIIQHIIDSWRYYMIGGFYSVVLPGAIGGDVVRLGLCVKAHGKSKALVATSIFFERACGIMVILLMASIAAFYTPIFFENEQAALNLIYGISIFVLTSFILFFFILKTSKSSLFDSTQSYSSWKGRVVELLLNFRKLPLSKLSIFLLLSLMAHFLDILGSFFLSKALHVEQPLFIFLLIMPLVYVFTTIPISIGGVGVREGVLTFFLVKVGVMPSDAVLLAFLIYLNRVLVGLVGGILQFRENKQPATFEKHENLP